MFLFELVFSLHNDIIVIMTSWWFLSGFKETTWVHPRKPVTTSNRKYLRTVDLKSPEIYWCKSTRGFFSGHPWQCLSITNPEIQTSVILQGVGQETGLPATKQNNNKKKNTFFVFFGGFNQCWFPNCLSHISAVVAGSVLQVQSRKRKDFL